MVWKIFFVIAAFLVCFMGIQSFAEDSSSFSLLQSLAGIVFVFVIACVLGIFYSLGWKQQLFPKKAVNIFIALFILSIISFSMICGFGSYPDIYAETQNALASTIGCLVNFAIFFVIANLFLIPFYVGLFIYKKDIDSLKLVEKPYWKLFALLTVNCAVYYLVYALTKFGHFALYNFIDYIAIFSNVYEAMFIIGFAWNIRIFNRLFWQITAVPYLILTIMTYFFVSDVFNKDFQYKSNNLVEILTLIIQYVIFIIIIYQYAYKKEVVQKKKKIKSVKKAGQN